MRKRWISVLAALLFAGITAVSNTQASALSDNAIVSAQGDIAQGEQAEKPECPAVQCLDSSQYAGYTADHDLFSTETAGTKYLFLGDSTACGYLDGNGNEIRSYVYYFQERRSADVTNVAIGGATLTTRDSYNIFFEMNRVDLASYDVAFFQFGINDCVRAVPIGSAYSRDKSTICGALNTAVSTLEAEGIQCYCILPFYYKGQFTHIVNESGLTFDKYVAAIKNTCARNGITVIDFNTSFGINKDNFWNYYIDSVHPGALLHQRAGEYLDAFMQEYDDESQVMAFIDRLYELCLNRPADENGMNDWKTALQNRSKSGAVVAQGFFFSDELKQRGLSDEQFVELLYQVMMNRSSDESGRAYWLCRLEAGVSREGVFKGFAESEEFKNICAVYGIEQGRVGVSEGRDRNIGLTMFVSRLYTKALGRAYDTAGLNDWCSRICDGTWSVTDVATEGFFESEEFQNKNLNDEEYVKVLYQTFLDREYDKEGLADWVDRLDTGAMTRKEVLKGFSYSEEFSKMMKEYGL